MFIYLMVYLYYVNYSFLLLLFIVKFHSYCMVQHPTQDARTLCLECCTCIVPAISCYSFTKITRIAMSYLYLYLFSCPCQCGRIFSIQRQLLSGFLLSSEASHVLARWLLSRLLIFYDVMCAESADPPCFEMVISRGCWFVIFLSVLN